MSIIRNLALGAWYGATLPWRMAWRCGAAPVAILYYHRVADEHPNPWTISNRRFARQIRWLKRRVELISLAEAQRRIAVCDSPRPAVAITFDDGYAENCERALPLLIQERIPCTYFVASQFVLESQPFSHDALARKPLPVNTPAQLRSLAGAGIEIGAHTRTHADLGPVRNREILYKEVVGSREELEAMIGHPVRYFAFPYGLHRNLNGAVFELAREAGFVGCCSAYGGYNFPGGDAFHLQRLHADPQMLRLKNWATIDPRKAYTTIPFHYRRLSSQASAAEFKA